MIGTLLSMRGIELLAACAIVFLADLRLRKMIRGLVEAGVAGALHPMTKAIGENTSDIQKIRGELKEHFALIRQIDERARAAHDRLDTLGAPRVVRP